MVISASRVNREDDIAVNHSLDLACYLKRAIQLATRVVRTEARGGRRSGDAAINHIGLSAIINFFLVTGARGTRGASPRCYHRISGLID